VPQSGRIILRMRHTPLLLQWSERFGFAGCIRNYQVELGGHLVGDADQEGLLQRRHRLQSVTRHTADARYIGGRTQRSRAEGLKVVDPDGAIPLTGVDDNTPCLEKILAATGQSLVLQVEEPSPLIAVLRAAGYKGATFDGVDDSAQLLSNPPTEKAVEAAYVISVFSPESGNCRDLADEGWRQTARHLLSCAKRLDADQHNRKERHPHPRRRPRFNAITGGPMFVHANGRESGRQHRLHDPGPVHLSHSAYQSAAI
jgi:hypothetical protein